MIYDQCYLFTFNKTQLGAWSSHQSEKIESRNELEKEYNRLKKYYSDKEIPKPPFWGGYNVFPESYEFWQGRKNRLHDRIYYQLKEKKWTWHRLSP